MTIRRLNDSAIRKLRASFISTIAQCVVELVQNSLDALATSIEIHVDLMKFFIQITDNGSGITPDDMKKIGERYATSKCHTLEDLANVITYGFRGEALSSLAEVSILEIISKHPDSYDTYSTILKGGQRLQYGPTRSSRRKKPGTIIIIRDLFYTYPVRRKHLSENKFINELENVKKSVESIALINPQVTFILIDALRDRKIVTTRKVTNSISTFRQLFGSSLAQSLEKYPVFFIHLTCPTTNYDICLDPAKNIIEFKNWSKILGLFSALVSQFLVQHGFSLREIESIPSLDNSSTISIINQGPINHKRELPLSLEDIFHIKSGGQNRYTFHDKEFKRDLYYVSHSDDLIEDNKDSENNFKANGPSSQELNTRKSKSRSSSANNKLKAKIDRSKLRTSIFHNDDDIVNNFRAISWAKETFEKWNNPVFRSTEVPIPMLKVMTANNKFTLITSNFFSTRSNVSEHRFCKKDIEHAKVIGQLDDKFIACKLPCAQNIDQNIDDNGVDEQRPRNILVLVDQHAADERVRVEMLMKEFCEFKKPDRMDIEDDSDIQQAISFVETIQLKPSNKIILTFRETQAVRRFEDNFNKWGIFFSDKCETKTDNTSNTSTTSFVSPHFISSKEGDLIPIYVTHLPKMIADRCVLDARMTQELIRQHLYWLEDTGGIGIDFSTNDNTDESREWRTMIRKCPRGIVDILNSKACRELITKLAECDFPFQCAHGRPSMVPVLYLNGAQKPISVYGQLNNCDWKKIGIKSLTTVDQTDSQGTESSWKRRKINLGRYRM
ncbi:1264_t:CDS:10 [Funneliformis geosporum]|uniref:15500_t:CDS:1 n=1 Tax=Funneliformis geosporum TaxID=1117311 RepID=A0A9W4SPF0_9GLOM|nr:1264_t:CDS:10 [Funneliformis geosporum]CAI2176037.1 15500_t:CDS:10 [Funneliformis geosporum]